MTRSVRIALALGAVAFGLAAPALPGLAATCAGASAATGVAAQSTIRVGVAVDDGTSSPRVDCIVVPAKSVQGELRATGAAVLAARASQLGLPAPRWGASGLLCGIDGFPATGCAEPSSAGYDYWSYWQGEAGQWVYSSTGPAYRYLKDGGVDGWRFGNGGGTGRDTTPRVGAAAVRCPTAPAPGPPTTTSPTPTNPGGGGAATPTTRLGSTSGTRPGATPGSRSGTTVVPAGGQPAPAPTTTVAPIGDPAATIPDAPTTTVETEVEAASQERDERADDTVEIAADDDGGGGGGWAGTAVGVGALGAAAAGAIVLGRRRRAEP